MRCYVVVPGMATQSAGYSDIGGSDRDLTTYYRKVAGPYVFPPTPKRSSITTVMSFGNQRGDKGVRREEPLATLQSLQSPLSRWSTAPNGLCLRLAAGLAA